MENLEAIFKDRMKAAMKAKNADELNVIRAIRSKVGEETKKEGFSGTVDDALYQRIIASYSKAMKKAHGEFLKTGDAGAENAAKLAYEVEYLAEFLPKKLDEAGTRPLVEAAIAATGATSKKQIGMVMGRVMKAHGGEVEPGIVRQVADSLLE